MRPTDRRHLLILAEGQFGAHSAKTAYGVIRYGPDDIVAVLDSTRAGENVAAFLPGHDIPIIGTLAEGLAHAHPTRRIADRHRADRGPAARDVADRHPRRDRGRPRRPVRPAHVRRRRSGVRRAGRSEGHDHRRLPPAAGAVRDGGRAPPPPRQAGDPDGRHGLCDRQDVGLAGAAPGRGRVRRQRDVRRHRPDRDDDRRLGRRGGPGDQRLRPGHGRVAGRAGRGTRRLGLPRGPGIARPSGLLVGHARADPRRDAARDGHGPQARAGEPRLRSPARGLVPDRGPARVHRPPRARRRARRAIAGRRRGPQYVAHPRRTGGAPGHRGDRRGDGAAGGRSGSVRRGRLWPRIRERVDDLPWVRGS